MELLSVSYLQHLMTPALFLFFPDVLVPDCQQVVHGDYLCSRSEVILQGREQLDRNRPAYLTAGQNFGVQTVFHSNRRQTS